MICALWRNPNERFVLELQVRALVGSFVFLRLTGSDLVLIWLQCERAKHPKVGSRI